VLNAAETGTETSGGREYMEHRGAKNYSGNSVSWTFDWQAPAGPNNETITFYFSSVLANNNGAPTGDNVVNSNFPVLLQAPTPPVPSIDNITHVSCNGGNDGAISASASGGTPPYNFNWSNGMSGASISGLSAGTYTLTVSDQAGQSATIQATVNQPSPLALSQQNVEPLTCTSPAVVTVEAAGGSPGYSYDWSNGASGPHASLTLADLPATVTATDNNGCTSTLTISSVPTDLDAPQAQALGGTITCQQPQVTLSGAGSSEGACFTYQWTGPGGFSAMTLNPIVANPGIYTLVVTNVCNGCTSSAEAVVTEDIDLPLINISLSDTLSCLNPVVEINAGFIPGQTYQWSTQDGEIAYGADSVIVGVSKSAIYTLVVTTEQSGCTASATVFVPGFTAPNWQVDTLVNLRCFGDQNGIAGLSGQGGLPPYAFLWPDSSASTFREDLGAGIYVVTISDQNGCLGQDTMVISGPEVIALNLSKTDESAPGADDGSASSAPKGGNPPYAFLWSNGATDPLVEDLSPGTYGITVTDSLGCTQSGQVIIQPFGCELAAEASFDPPLCYGGTGSITLSVSGANGPVVIQWSNGGSGPLLEDIPTGDYTVELTDSIGCNLSMMLTLTEPDAISVALDSLLIPSGPAALDGAIFITVTGGTPPYSFQWLNDLGVPVGSEEDLINGGEGNYYLGITDQNGCRKDTSFALLVVSITANWADLVRMYPNPAPDQLTLSLPETGRFHLSLWDARGQLVREETGLQGFRHLDMTSLAPGLHILRLRDELGHQAIYRVLR
jgi:hypothetical protein